jgi:glycerol-3-phosphate acyltransferase PlsX
MRIAVDAMGGDHAPREIVRGAVAALRFLGPSDELVLIGNPQAIETELAAVDGFCERIRIEPTTQVIGMDEEPVEALRRKKDSSIVRMVQMHAAGRVDAILSAGNTGACAAAAQLGLRAIPGVSRAGIAIVLPSFSGPTVMCDVGANVSPKPHHLYQYALMGSVYAKGVLGLEPRVGLLSVGEEEEKGNTLVHKARELIKADPFLRFAGNVEGRDLIFGGSANVVVCDGFVGNIVLKLIEGVVESLIMNLSTSLGDAMPELGEKIRPVLKGLFKKLDYNEYGGAPLLGVDGAMMICHGRSNQTAIANAVRTAAEFVRAGVNKVIASQLAKGVGVGGHD